MDMLVREANQNDWEQIKGIYEQGIATRNATFETKAPDNFLDWASKSPGESFLVACNGDKLLGWCKISPVSDRRAYAGVGEVSVYVHNEARGKGVGQTLLATLIHKSEANGFWTLNAGIFPENEASLKLHQKNGFREVGVKERIGKMNGIWRDVVLLERRSHVVGLD